ncbi:cell division protein ZapA [Sphingomonas koreensis]|uniref:Cell division protein ZapA n=1 Tax=Sphingomonas koreensis TaxID=93064 RepID=A0A2M8W984_9SPHN|nr:cell division protein ZapA [Sphingomonas koreensis]PJI87495.1 cell division protein ZapA [Sphingomonas koreensis]RSU62880.1 cell division protein ZapA [Sphingomonas koreensis]RSU71590.1 cell division protein ZapA [Sphingomonas koreensis]RSY88776.1 cell division protein ZapA [Sphingomonas koreensis]
MGQITLTVAGRSHTIACRDGEEVHLERLERMLNKHAETALAASGGMSGERTMLFIALILADLLDEAERNPPGGVSPVLLDTLAARLESVAAALEDRG